MDWTGIEAPSLDEIERLAREAYAKLPEKFRSLCGDVRSWCRNSPATRSCATWSSKPNSTCWAFTRARPGRPGRQPRPAGADHDFPLSPAILDYWAEHHIALGALVRHVIVHEIGHHFGLSDDDMEAIEGGD